MVSRAARAVPFLLLAALPACNVMGPDYRRPALPLPKDFAAAAGTPVQGFTLGANDPWARWWTVFGDPELDRLVAAAREGNQDLRAAAARVLAARAIARAAGASLLPEVSGNLSQIGQKASSQSFSVSRSTSSTLTWATTLDASYELDAFGRIRRGVEAACAEAFATEEDRRAVEISLIASVAEAYFDLGAAEAEIAIARESAGLLEKTLSLVTARFEGKLVGEIDMRRTEGDLATARAIEPEAVRRRAVAAHALSVLLGTAPGGAFVARPTSSFVAPPEVPVGLPAGLVERRPDVRAAELRARAANARVGEAIAAFYPSITLASRFGWSSTKLGDLLTPAANLWSIGPSIHVPIFEGGLLAARKFQRTAETDEAMADYVHTVLLALAEVADAIVGLSARLQVRDLQQQAVDAAQRSTELSGGQYEGGLTPYVNVLDAQRALLSSRLARLAAQRAVLSEIVRLGKALGGGWEQPCPAPTPAVVPPAR